jgi:hypothetical protein
MPSKLQGEIVSRLSPRWVAWALIALAAVILYLRFPGNADSYRHGPPTDFAVYLRAWERASAGQSPYVPSDPSPYKYAPGVLALVRAIPHASPGDAWVVFSTACILGLAVALGVGARYQRWRSVGWLALGLGLAWKGILETFDYGQVEIVILAIAVLAGDALRRSPFLGGLLAGTLPWFKLPWALLLMPFILITVSGEESPKTPRRAKRFRLLVSGYLLAWFIWGAAVPSLVFGPERAQALSHEWIALLRTQPAALYFSDINQSFWVSAIRWMGGATPLLPLGVVGVFSGLLLGSFVTRIVREGQAPAQVFAWLSPWLVFTQLLNPLSWRWGSVFVIGMPFAIAGSAAHRRRGLAALLWAGVALLWLAQLNPVVRALGFGHWSELHGYGIVTFYWLLLLLLCV